MGVSREEKLSVMGVSFVLGLSVMGVSREEKLSVMGVSNNI